MRSHIKIYFDFEENCEKLNDAEKGRLLLAMLRYAQTGEAPDLKGNERYLWPVFKASINRDIDAYDQKAAAGSAGGSAMRNNGSTGKQTEANKSTSKQGEAEESKPKENAKKEERRKRKEEQDQDGGNGTRARAGEAAPFGEDLSESEISAALERDRQIEEAAAAWGLPCREGNMIEARRLASTYSLAWMVEAIEVAGNGKEQTWRYVRGILESWKANGGPEQDKRRARSTTRRVSAQDYTQRDYTEAELLAVSDDLIAEAKALRDAEGA